MTTYHPSPEHTKDRDYDLIIIGAGAAGIGCGIALKEWGINHFIILERHEIGASFNRWPEEMRFITPSFTSNGFGFLDLNAVAVETSPAYTLRTEHPGGREYALYLQAVAEHFDLPIQEGIDVHTITPPGPTNEYILSTSHGQWRSRYIIWAAGEFQYPRQPHFPGAEHTRHSATINTWQEIEGDKIIIIGGYESGIDAAIHLSDLGKPDIPIIQPSKTWYEHTLWGPWLSLITLVLLFGLPVYLSYILADWLQPLLDDRFITLLVTWLSPVQTSSPLLHALLVGDYGVITLGWYSFLWAFPVVLFIGVSVAVTEEVGLKDRITASLDPWLRRIGLNGRDLIPVLSGYGCNVVAVFQSRACGRCTRETCTSLIGYGSACSYQIGATLSLFAIAGYPGLFVPYLLLLFVVGALHTRLWYKPLPPGTAVPLTDRAFLQRPTWRGIVWRVRTVLKQFLWQAMPIFLLMCAVGATLAYTGLLDWLAESISPLMELFGLPGAVTPGVIFAMVRKDGLLILNQGEGALLASLTVGQLFVLVYLASTLTACLVTLWTVRKELGGRVAVKLVGRQAVTSLVSTFLLAMVLR